jgi:hypothetical protein
MKHIEPSCSPFIWTCEYVYNATLDVTYIYTVLNAIMISVCKMFSVSHCMVRWYVDKKHLSLPENVGWCHNC